MKSKHKKHIIFYHNLMVAKIIQVAKLTLEKVVQNISILLQT